MTFQDFDVETQNRAVVLDTAVDDAVDDSFPPECANMLRDFVFGTNLDVFRREI